MELQCLLTCDHYLLACHWALLFHSSSLKPSSIAFLEKRKPRGISSMCIYPLLQAKHSCSLSLSSYDGYSSFLIIFVAFCLTSSSMSMCLLHGVDKPWAQGSNVSHQGWVRGRITSPDLQAMLFLMQHRRSSLPQEHVAGSWSAWCSPESTCPSLWAAFQPVSLWPVLVLGVIVPSDRAWHTL